MIFYVIKPLLPIQLINFTFFFTYSFLNHFSRMCSGSIHVKRARTHKHTHTHTHTHTHQFINRDLIGLELNALPYHRNTTDLHMDQRIMS